MDEQRKLPIGEVEYREATFDREKIDQEKRTVPLAFSSEEPVERWFGSEILDHSPKSVQIKRLRDGGPLLLNHDTGDHVGVVISASIDADKVGRAVVKFSRSAMGQEVFQDVIDGVRSKVSVGYRVNEMVLEKKEGNTETYRVTSWEPLEVSLVSVPADVTVGVGRELTKQHALTEGEIRMEEGKNNTPATVKELSPEEKAKLRVQNETEIREVAEHFKTKITGGEKEMAILVENAIKAGIDASLFRGTVFTMAKETRALEVNAELGMSEKEKKSYSLARAIDAMARRDMKNGAPFELELSNELAKRFDKEPKGFYLPVDINKRNHAGAEMARVLRNAGYTSDQILQRDLTVGSATAGGNLVGTDLTGFIELLRPRMVTLQAGVQVLSGLKGNVAIPSQTGAGTFSWVAENNAPSETALTVGQLTLAPNDGTAYMDYSRRLLLQSTPSIDMLIENDLRSIAALGIDAAILAGTGGNTPQGIIGTSGIGAVSAAGAGWDAVVEFETDITSANADAGSMKFIMNAAAKGLFKTRLKAANTGIFLMAENGEMNGYPSLITNQMPAANVLFGDFSQAVLAEWGTVDVLSDPYTGSNAGTTRVTIFVTVDVGVRQVGAFSAATDLS